jgi:two-component system chemotaxis sensor kinase CheA
MSIVVEPVEIAEMLQGIEALFSPLAEGKNVAMSCRIDPSLPQTIVTDSHRIKQILRNFLSNAVKFVDRGEVCLVAEPPTQRHLESLRSDRDLAIEAKKRMQDYVVLAVSDTGIGIQEERQEAIFEAFRQADGTISRKYGGTGLGLNIVTKLASLLGGAVGLWSVPGEGSTFFVLLPKASKEQSSSVVELPLVIDQLRAAPLSDDGPEFEMSMNSGAGERAAVSFEPTDPQAPMRPADWGSGKRLLLVDDDLRNSYALTIVLEAEGFEVTAAANGVAALEALDQAPAYDGVLMDIMMPEMDGYEAMRRLRADGRFDELPVLALTARTQEEDRAACFEAGATDFLTKPIDRDLLMSRLFVALLPAEA